MDNPNFITEHCKGQHLTSEKRHDIVVHLKDGWSKYRIAKHLNRLYNTIKNEIWRGTVALFYGKVLMKIFFINIIQDIINKNI